MISLPDKPDGLGMYCGYAPGDPRRVVIWQAAKKSWSATIGYDQKFLGAYPSKEAAVTGCWAWMQLNPPSKQ